LDRAKRVPVAGRLFVMLRVRGFAHLVHQRAGEIRVASFEEELGVGDGFSVLLRGGLPGARGEALIEVIVETGATLPVEHLVAGRNLEEAWNHLQRSARDG